MDTELVDRARNMSGDHYVMMLYTPLAMSKSILAFRAYFVSKLIITITELRYAALALTLMNNKVST